MVWVKKQPKKQNQSKINKLNTKETQKQKKIIEQNISNTK
jgi:hypothetical protein